AENVISENNITENYNGIYLDSSSSNTISRNNVTANHYSGIVLSLSSNNVLSGNSIIANSMWGINPAYSNNNTISGNNIRNNNVGINSASSDFNIVSANKIIDNRYSGIYLESSSNNRFHHNNLINNTNQVVVELGYANNWDDGFEGNYWSNYTGVDLNRDGIGDSWFEMDENNTDHYPLMGMFSSFNTSLGLYVNVISNSTIEDFEYFEFNNTIRMHISNMTTNQTYGFSRIRIPHALMNETYHVTIDGTEPNYVNYTLSDDEENRWIYFSYQHSMLEIVIVPEFPSFIVLPLLMIATLLAVIVCRKKQLKALKQG
ncbi:MAG TPA: NosD domain-containing protein, partial [Patescibacteria group bacterium]|nr:NosD domain-containing protein [Patescibacteria group bacterium]